MARKRIRQLTSLSSMATGGYWLVIDPPVTGDALKVLDTTFRDFVLDAADDRYLQLVGGALSGALTVPDEAYDATAWNASLGVPTKNALRDKIETLLPLAGGTLSGDLVVPAEVYGAGWNDSNEVPTKNDVYDKVEAIVAGIPGTFTTEDAQDAVGAMVDGSLTYVDATPRLQRAALTGDVTAAAGSNATTITADAVTYAKLQNVSATDKLLGRSTAGAGDVEEITCTAAGRALIDDANAAAQLVTLGAKAAAPSIQAVTSSATVTPTFADDQVNITAQAAALALANPTGTAVPAWGLAIRIKDNGTARAISYDTQYRAIGVTLPTTTVISKTLYLGMIYNSTDTKWDVVAVAQEA